MNDKYPCVLFFESYMYMYDRHFKNKETKQKYSPLYSGMAYELCTRLKYIYGNGENVFRIKFYKCKR